ncbi:hypothetical protein CHRY9390_02531 [Chryseobacterium aquaeductus]|uniref:Uncharacterized protein n=1 Tax=Chryseobacterium aquaeductus TaxID=2675056 RepID=A0A9N8MI32_9FLAO|nr:hypothetical protein CHRY9390_02531 [Chryseobacterium potabilaquae]CAD7812565.1 hypothetical protein CHRY9390_02531 [Chryseobacterium aquaeductus]
MKSHKLLLIITNQVVLLGLEENFSLRLTLKADI